MDFKNTLRKEISKNLKHLDNVQNRSQDILENIKTLNTWKECNKVFLYLHFRDEVHTDKLIDEAIKSGKRVYAPLISVNRMDFYRIDHLNKDEYVINRYGIKEPPTSSELSYPDSSTLCIVPGLAFSKNGERMGRGGGYYDRYLERFPNLKTVAVCFNIQICDNIPVEDWDKTVDIVVTEGDIYGN